MTSTIIYLPYVYQITNKITKQFYVGMRSQNKKFNRTPEDDIWIKYFTSSEIIKNQIKLFGVENFNIKILFRYDDTSICYHYEQLSIRLHKTNKLCLNEQFHDPDTMKQIFFSDSSQYSNERRSILSKKMKGQGNHMFGKTHSNEVKLLISKLHKGIPERREIVEKRSKTHSGDNHWRRKRPSTPEHFKKISIALTGRKKSDEDRLNLIIKKIKNFEPTSFSHFLKHIKELRASGMTTLNIAKHLNLSYECIRDNLK
jgi:hypothetical protein